MSINIILDTHIKLNPADFPAEVIEGIKSLLTIPNSAKNRAEREMLWGAKSLPEYIELWEETSSELVLPRGFANEFIKVINEHDLFLQWTDNTYIQYESDLFADVSINLRDYQLKAADAIIDSENGIYKSSTGSGKSITMLGVVAACNQKTIIFCEKSDIQDQWIKFANELGFDSVGEIGDGVWDDTKDLTIALRQSVWSRRNQLNDDWYRLFGMVIWDEVHRISAPTANELIQRFPARYRFGCSATPDSDPDLFPIISAAIGLVVAFSPIKEIGDHLVIPSVRVVDTEFTYPYRPTFRRGAKVIRNNYNSMCKALEEDSRRNVLITGLALEEAIKGNTCIILSKRKKHLEYMAKEIQSCISALCEEWKLKGIEPAEVVLNMLTGDNSSGYSDIKNDIESYECGSILFSTLAEEGTDIVRLDRLFLAYPGRKLRFFEQAIGRIMRPASGKKDAIVYDFRDKNVSLLNSQFRFRAQGLYHKKEYKVDMNG